MGQQQAQQERGLVEGEAPGLGSSRELGVVSLLAGVGWGGALCSAQPSTPKHHHR